MNWRKFIANVESVSKIPRIKAAGLGYAYKKLSLNGRSSTLASMIRA